jgi:hypothetical protein
MTASLAHRLGLTTEQVIEALAGGPLVSAWQAAKLDRIAKRARRHDSSVAAVHRVAAVPQAPGELLLHGDGFVAGGHRVEAPIQPWAKVLAVFAHIPGGSVAILVLAKAFPRRHRALADVEGGIPGVAAGTDRVVQLDHVDVVAALGCSWLGPA